jgi:hypothetical protein
MFSNITGFSEALPFRVTSKSLRVTDPCYGDDISVSGNIAQVKNGNWLSQVGYFQDQVEVNNRNIQRKEDLDFLHALASSDKKEREEVTFKAEKEWSREDDLSKPVAYLRVVHESETNCLGRAPEFIDVMICAFDVTVESGHAGFFDEKPYVDAITEKLELFLDVVAGKANGLKRFGVIDIGATSFAGYGYTAGYSCFVRLVEGLVVDAFICFISGSASKDDFEEKGENYHA